MKKSLFSIILFVLTIINANAQKVDIKVTDLTCFGDSSGKILLDVIGGIPPYFYYWSDTVGYLGNKREKLSAGEYLVTVKDNANFSELLKITVKQPLEMKIFFREMCYSVSLLFERSWDHMIIDSIHHATFPVQFLENSKNFSSTSASFPEIKIKSHPDVFRPVYFKDAKGCQTQIKATRLSRAGIRFGLRPDTVFLKIPQQDIEIDLIVKNLASPPIYKDTVQTIYWYQNTNFLQKCDMCTNVKTNVKEGDKIYAYAYSNKGCHLFDTTYVLKEIPPKDTIKTIPIVSKDNVFVPNIFSPNDDGINDYFFINSDESIERIDWFMIYDRWGNLIFERNDIPPNDATFGWNGYYKGIVANKGTYLCAYQIRLKNKSIKTYKEFFEIKN